MCSAGTLPAAWGDFSQLTYLDLTGNWFTGRIRLTVHMHRHSSHMHPNPTCINPAALVHTCTQTCLALCVRIRHTSRILAAAQHARHCVTYTVADKDHLVMALFPQGPDHCVRDCRGAPALHSWVLHVDQKYVRDSEEDG